MVRIRIPEQSERARGMVEMARRGRIICLPADEFIVPEPALTLLQSLGVEFEEIERGGHDFAEKALRDATPPAVHREPTGRSPVESQKL